MGFRFKNIKVIMLFAVLIVAGVSLGSYEKAYAGVGQCGINSGELDDYAGLLVSTTSVDTASVTGYSNVKIHISTKFPSYSNSAGNFDSSGTGYYNLYKPGTGTRKTSVTYKPESGLSGCIGNEYGVVLSHDGTDDINGNRWMLDCDHSFRASSGLGANPSNPYQSFYVQPEGTPSGLRPGGWWEVKAGASYDTGDPANNSPPNAVGSQSNPYPKVTVTPRNGNTAKVVFVYHEPAQPPDEVSTVEPKCTRSIVDNGGVRYGAGNFETRTKVTITGATPSRDDYIVDFNTSQTFDYMPTGQSVTVSTFREYLNGDGDWIRENGSSTSDTLTPCYVAKCTITSIASNAPGGKFIPGSTVNMSARVWNTGPTELRKYLPIPPPGSVLQLQQNGGDIGFAWEFGPLPTKAQSSTGYVTDLTIPIVIPTGRTSANITAQMAYAGQFFMGTSCGANIDIVDPPKIEVEAAICGGNISGWAYSPEQTDLSIQISITADANVSVGTFDANLPRGDVNADLGIPGNHGFSVPIPASYFDGVAHTFNVTAIDPFGVVNTGPVAIGMTACRAYTYSPSAAASGDNEDPTTITFSNATGLSFALPAGAPNCVNPTTISYSIYKDNVNGGNDSLETGTDGPRCVPNETKTYYSFDVPPGSFESGDKFCIDVSINPGSGFVDNAGQRVGNAGAPATDTGCLTIVSKPYFKVYGSGISAGGNFQAAGSCSGGGVLAGYYRNDSTVPAFNYGQGASAELYGSALSQIKAFATAQATPFKSPTELTFANSDPSKITGGQSIDPNLGGNYDTTHCLDDVEVPTDPAADKTDLPGGSVIGTTMIGPGQNKSFFVENGDVYITGNGVNYTPSAWQLNNVPSYVLRVKGNIYIDPGVRTLDGLYIAEPRVGEPNTGQIFTCARQVSPGVFDTVAANSRYGTCNKQLTVRGNFIARKVNLMRTYGSLRDEKPTTGTAGTPIDGRVGVEHPLIWSHAGKPAEGECTQILEDAEPSTGTYPENHGWDDNWLCVDPRDAAVVDIDWSRGGPDPVPVLPRCGSFEVVENYGDPYTWSDNQLCSNAESIRFVIATDNPATSTELCTQIFEPWDSDINPWQQDGIEKAYVCIATYDPGGGMTAGTLPVPLNEPLDCSNDGGSSYTPVIGRPNTCAAEVFEFSPEMYLAKPAIRPENNGALKFDAITSLPPVL